MDTEILLLSLTAGSIGFLHTLLGPDHYLPFIAMAKARLWSLRKTAAITALCGLGHVLGSVAIGLTGIALGIGVMQLESLETMRGNIAAWLLIGFGLAYFAWGLNRAFRDRSHDHLHDHVEQSSHAHVHSHHGDHAHAHAENRERMTPWVLFTIFLFGPCEPLIPILMYPAAKSSLSGLVIVTAIFAVVTITTMLTVVLVSVWGIGFARIGRLEPYAHALAGATICLCGLSIQLLGV